jgi:nicotinamide-nucleotide amidase
MGETERLAAEVGTALKSRGWRLALAESCTGGGLAEAVTAVAGSSEWFDRGWVTYSNAAKVELLGVSPATLESHGAVSEETAREMAAGALARSRSQVALAVTGIAGPGGGSPLKPVGTVCFAWAAPGQEPQATTRHFPGERRRVRRQSIAYALRQLLLLAHAA